MSNISSDDTMSNAALASGFIAAQVGETLSNYSRADEPLDPANRGQPRSGDYAGTLFDDGEFWRSLLSHPLHRHQTLRFQIYHAAITEWIARVPGLYWRRGSAAMRKLSKAAIESETDRWRTYKPQGKSQQVSGGIGTLRFPPAVDGYRLVTLTTSYNGSTGVPALVSPEVWDHHHLAEGCIIDGSAAWRPLPQQWDVLFPVVRGIPRGCLMIDQVQNISPRDRDAPIQVHPFSVMEYWDGSAQLHDFVYASADTGASQFRGNIETFFDSYRQANDRQGRYLVSADISEPMWDAVFSSPEDMRYRKEAQLRLIEARVRDAANGQKVVEALIKELSRLKSVVDLKRLSVDAGIDPNRWSEGGLIAEESARLVDKAVQSEKQQALLQVVLLEGRP
jgi:hypothetical protein